MYLYLLEHFEHVSYYYYIISIYHIGLDAFFIW